MIRSKNTAISDSIAMEKKKMMNEKAMIVALKGHPGTGKSTLARAIASALRCPLIDKDHFRDSVQKIQQTLITATKSSSARLLNDLSYEAMWRVTSAQLGLGLSVVVDSPLSRRAHLDRLLDLAAESDARVIVVECRPGDEGAWRRRVELREDTGGGHKPSTWAEMERLLEGYGGCWDYDVGEEVPKIVLDTTANIELAELVSKVIGFISSEIY